MGAAYFIVLDNPNPGFDPFVNGKAIAQDAERLSQIASSLGLKTPNEYVSISGEDAASIAEDFGIDDDIQAPPERWFLADEGLEWVRRLTARIRSDAKAVEDAHAVLEDLAEYERVLSHAKKIGARWHLSVDF